MHFYTHIRIGLQNFRDDAGQEFSSLADAKIEANRSVREIMIGCLQRGNDIPSELFIEIADRDGRVLELISADMLLVGSGLRDQQRKLFEAVHHAYLLITPDFVIIDANPAYLRATMTDLPQIKHREVFQVFPDNPGDSKASGVRNVSASLGTVLKTRRPYSIAPQRYDIRRRDGSWEERYWKAVHVPVLDDNGEVEFIVVNAEDVTTATIANARP